MTKSAAGLIPVIIVAAFFVWNPDRPPVRRLLQAAALIALLALPWHLYQLWRHPHWFTTEYVMHELLGKGLGNPAQTTADSPAIFYADRLWRLDPVLCLAALVALAAAWKRSRLLLVWLGVVAVVALTFRYRNVSYILPAYPAMAILVGIAIPRRLAKAALGVALAALACKVALPDRVWGLPHGPEFANHSQEALKRYSALKRPNELIIIDPDDQFFAPLFHPTRVRYVYQGDIGDVSRDELDYHAMGIAVTVEEFARLDERMPQFEQRLQAMDLNSTKPVATVIWARNEAEIAALLAGHPRSDFYLPMRWAHLGNPAHQQREGTSERVFLLGAE
jgi:hypothetical protein